MGFGAVDSAYTAIAKKMNEGERRAVADALSDLLSWSCTFNDSAVPPEIRSRALLVLADDLGAIAAAVSEPEVAAVYRQAKACASLPEATALAELPFKTSRSQAAFANAIACSWTELDEGYRPAACHGGLYTVPAAIAEAEAVGLSLGKLLIGIIVGYEVAARFAGAWEFPRLTLHPHAVWSPIGAAAAVGRLRGLSEATFTRAVTGATTLASPGPLNHAVNGTLIRNVWAAYGAWVGLSSADLAAAGIGGSAQSPYDVLSVALRGRVTPGRLNTALGSSWAISDGYHKLYACCQWAHSAVEAALALHDQLDARGGPQEVARVLVETHELGLSLNNMEPTNTLAGKFSMQHAVATALTLGRANALAFSSRMLHDEAVRSLRHKVSLSRYEPEQPAPHDRPARIRIQLKSGTELVEECLSARGGLDRPLSQAEVLEKVASVSEGASPALAETFASLLSDAKALDTNWRTVIGKLITPFEHGGQPNRVQA